MQNGGLIAKQPRRIAWICRRGPANAVGLNIPGLNVSVVTRTNSGETMDKVLFGERLRNAREATGMSEKRMANRIGVKTATVKKWENGELEPRANRVQMIASLLNVPLLWLLAGGQQVPVSTGDASDPQLLRQKIAEVNAKMNSLRASLDELDTLVENCG
jgi:transcriptional regulator with XRE-family HTH domain